MPYPNEHACRLKDPDQYDSFARKDCAEKHDGKCIDVIFGVKGGKSEIQALRYPKESWTVGAARSHCGARGGKFEAAGGKGQPGDEVDCRAYSILTVKSVDEERRVLEGVATTPTPDRLDDVVVPEGIQFKLPFPLLYQHEAKKPIGKVVAANVTRDGMTIRAEIGPAALNIDFIDEAWKLIKAGLVRGLSIGFRSLEESFDKERNAFNFLRTELLEVSAVTIPANAEANITTVKSADLETLAALGRRRRETVRLDATTNHPGVSGRDGASEEMKTIAEQIASFEAKRQADMARMTEIMNKAADESRTLDAAETEEYDTLQAEVKSVDEHLARLREHEKQIVAAAVPVTEKTAGTPDAAGKARGGVITVKGPDLPKGTAFTRYAMALMAARGNEQRALNIAQAQRGWLDTTPQVEAVLKAAVAAGTTSADGWASELADYTYMASEFIEFLRPQTIIGKLPGLRRVPFNIRLPLQDSGSTVGWVGEGGRKPVGKLHMDTVEFRFFKAAGIVVLTEELVRFSNPSAEALVRTDLAAAIAQFLDEEFIDPAVAGSANVSPASITNGAGNSAASGTTADAFREDLKTALTTFIAANIDPAGLAVVMKPIQAAALALMRNALGQKEFPDINASGGSIESYTVVTSNSVPAGDVVYVKQSEIMLADDGGINLDASREASIVMDDGGSPSVTTTHSMWQENRVALRVERIINWKRRRLAAVYYLTGCDYGSASSPA